MKNQVINLNISRIQLKNTKKKFQRSRDKSSPHTQRKTLSQCGSETKLHKFYIHSSKINNFQRDQQQGIFFYALQDQDFEFPKQKASNKIMNPQQDHLKDITKKSKEEEQLKEQLKKYKQKNQQLLLKLQVLTNTLNEYVKKQSKPMNKMRDNIQKQRITQLQTQNKNLKLMIQQLKEQLNQAKSFKINAQALMFIEQLQKSKSLESFNNIDDRLEYNQQTILNLNEKLKRLQLQNDFINRKSYSQIALIKTNYQKEFKSIKDKFTQVLKSNNQLKIKNMELIYKIKSLRQPKCTTCTKNKSKGAGLQRNQSLLSLSSD